jgi:hypothetical protein
MRGRAEGANGAGRAALSPPGRSCTLPGPAGPARSPARLACTLSRDLAQPMYG